MTCVLLCPSGVSWHPPGTPCTWGRWIWGEILESSRSCLVVCSSAGCGESLISETSWPQPKALSKHQERGCRGKGCPAGGGLQRHEHVQCSSSCGSQVPHCSEQGLHWSRMQFMISRAFPVPCVLPTAAPDTEAKARADTGGFQTPLLSWKCC